MTTQQATQTLESLYANATKYGYSEIDTTIKSTLGGLKLDELKTVLNDLNYFVKPKSKKQAIEMVISRTIDKRAAWDRTNF